LTSDEECLQFFKQRKQAKMLWLQNPNQSNVAKLCNVSHEEASRHFRSKKKEYLKLKLMELKQTGRTRILEACVAA
jgi:hypothetical protein